MNNNSHIVSRVEKGSIADELGITPGDELLKVNNTKIQDIFDYQYQINDEFITVLIKKPDGQEWELEIEKDYNADLGMEFGESLMDDYKSCKNKCIFCFIDQLPKGMRETLYFKDDDSRLSFLQGNYITLTNMKISDIERIVHYRLEPINISVHTTNPKLRCRMLNNRFAGDILEKIDILNKGCIQMNGQIVCCKGYNDGEELKKTIIDLSKYIPNMRSLCVVPFGMTAYRQGLTPIEKFTPDDCKIIIDMIEELGQTFLKKYGTRFVQASDEWYITARRPLPDADYYEGYIQIENGVGMVRSLEDEVDEYLKTLDTCDKESRISIATGVLASPYIKKLCEKINTKFPNIHAMVYTIINDFFGHDITVAGLLTGQDIISQLKDKELGERLILPDTLLRSNEQVLLDDMTISDIENALQIKIDIVKSDGKSFVDTVIGNL